MWINKAAGKLLPWWIVVCYSCHEQHQFRNSTEASIWLTRNNWKMVHDVWCCPRHAQEVEKIGVYDEKTDSYYKG